MSEIRDRKWNFSLHTPSTRAHNAKNVRPLKRHVQRLDSFERVLNWGLGLVAFRECIGQWDNLLLLNVFAHKISRLIYLTLWFWFSYLNQSITESMPRESALKLMPETIFHSNFHFTYKPSLLYCYLLLPSLRIPAAYIRVTCFTNLYSLYLAFPKFSIINIKFLTLRQ